MKKFKKIFLSGLIFIFGGFILFFSIKANAFSLNYTLSSSTQSHLVWGLADTSLRQNPSNTTTEYKLISLQKENYNDNDIVKIKNYFGDGDPQDPYEIKIRTYALTTSVYFYPSAGYLGFFYDLPNKKIYILTLQYGSDKTLEVGGVIANFSIAYELSEMTNAYINYKVMYLGAVSGDASTQYSENAVNGLLYLYSYNSYEANLLQNAKIQVYDEAYTSGYYNGFEDGQEGKNAITKVWEMFGGLFTLIGNVMAIELFPNIPIGVFFLIPLVFGAVGFIFWIWKRGS